VDCVHGAHFETYVIRRMKKINIGYLLDLLKIKKGLGFNHHRGEAIDVCIKELINKYSEEFNEEKK